METKKSVILVPMSPPLELNPKTEDYKRVLASFCLAGDKEKGKSPMRRSILYINVIGLLAVLLSACGQLPTSRSAQLRT